MKNCVDTMGSSPLKGTSTTNTFENHYIEYNRSRRPDVFPCEDCGRFFTLLAMSVHKRTCLENESCQCSVCRSDFKKAKPCSVIKSDDLSTNTSATYRYSKTRSDFKPHFQELLASEEHNIDNIVNEGHVITFKFSEKSSNIIDSVSEDKNTSECVDASVLTGNEVAAINDHEYISAKTDSPENFDMLSDNSNDCEKSPSAKGKQKNNDHDCDRKLYCRYCNLHVFWESFGIHIIQHCEKVDDTLLKCPECNRTFTQPALYLTHYLIHNSDHSVFCMLCRCSFATCIYTERAIEPNFAEHYPHHCYICLSHFSHPQTVINHMRLHSKEMPYQCTVCNRTFRQIGNLQRHMTTHRGDRPYKCPNCPSSFADPATLRNHERVHTGETPYVCPICNRGFSQVGNLKRHMPLHLQNGSTFLSSSIEVNSEENNISNIKSTSNNKSSGNTSAECLKYNNISDKVSNGESSDVTATNNVIRKSSRKNGKMKVFTCGICKKVYTWQHDLIVHFRTHTGEKPYECEICGKRFAQSGAIRTHKDRHHSGIGNAKQKNAS